MTKKVGIKELVDPHGASRLRSIPSQEHMDTNGNVKTLGLLIKRKKIGIPYVTSTEIGQQRDADESQLGYRASELGDRRGTILLRQHRGPFKARGIFRAIFRHPGVAGAGQLGRQGGVFKRWDGPPKSSSEEHGNFNSFTVHVNEPRLGIFHSLAPRMRLTIRPTNTNTGSAWFRPGLAFQGETQMAVAGRTAFRSHRPVFFRHSFFPVDVNFFKMAVGIDGGKFSAHRVSFSLRLEVKS